MLEPVVQLLLATEIWFLLFTRWRGGSDFGFRIDTTLFTILSFERVVCFVVLMNDETRGGTAIGGDNFGSLEELTFVEALELTEADWTVDVFEVKGGVECMVVQNATMLDDLVFVVETIGDWRGGGLIIGIGGGTIESLIVSDRSGFE